MVAKKKESSVKTAPKRRKRSKLQTLEDFGKYLAECRKSSKVSHQDISKETRIRVQYIKEIEKGDFSHFSAEIYVRAYLKAYAQCVGVSNEDVIKLYLSVVQGQDKVIEKEEEAPVAPPVDDNAREFKPDSRLIIAALGAFLLVYISWYSVQDSPEIEMKMPQTTLENQLKYEEHEAVLVALEDTNIGIVGSGGKVVTKKMQAGDTHTLLELKRVMLQLDDPSAVEIYLDGNAIPSLESLEKTTEGYVVLDVENISAKKVSN